MRSKARAEPLAGMDASDSLEALHPSLEAGFAVLYDREVPFEMRVQQEVGEQEQVGTLEALRTKILLLGNEDNPTAVRVELTSENDLFFNYSHSMDPDTFSILQDQQKLTIQFGEYCAMLIRLLNSCIREPHSYIAVFVLQKGGRAQIDIVQNMEYKYVELISCNCLASDDDAIREDIAFRYNALKSRLAMVQDNFSHLEALVKQKNPHLLLHHKKSHSKKAPESKAPESRSPWLPSRVIR